MGIINITFAYSIKISNNVLTFLDSFRVNTGQARMCVCVCVCTCFNPDQISEGTRVSHQKRSLCDCHHQTFSRKTRSEASVVTSASCSRCSNVIHLGSVNTRQSPFQCWSTALQKQILTCVNGMCVQHG